MRNEWRHIAGKLLWRLPLLALFALGFNQLYWHYFYEEDLDKYAQMFLDVGQMEDSCEVLYFGESSNFSYHPTRDTLEDRISDFISYHFPERKFGTINHAAYHAGLYVPLIERIDENSAVKTVIVTMNLRTLDQAVRYSELESAMQQEKVMFSGHPPLLKRTFLTLNFFDNRSALDRDKLKWEEWTHDVLSSEVDSISFPHPTIRSWCEQVKFPLPDGGEDMSKRALADHYIKAYAFRIDESNPRIDDFDEIVETCREKDIKVVFNLLAENVEYADSLVGDNLVWLMRVNRDYLVERYTTENSIVVDNLEAVGGFHFTDQNWTTEHYDQVGRQIIARNVADAMKRSDY